MDKQFARILMVSVLLPAGAAVAEAIQHAHVSLTAMDQSVISKLTGASQVEMMREAASGEGHSVENSSSEPAEHDQDGANGGAGALENGR